MESQNRDLLKRLQHMQRLVERACAERDLAYAEAAQWKHRYETEAHQRRLERSQSEPLDAEPPALEVEETDISEPNDEVTALKQELDQLHLALQKEKEEHQHTRASLITALGDALHRKPS